MEAGFMAFDALHWRWLIGLMLGIIVLTVVYARATQAWRLRIKRLLAYSILIGEVVKLFVVWQLGKSLLYYLPIHLCGFAIVLLMLHVYRPTALINEILFSLTLPGALIALIFPGWTAEPVMGFIHIHSFIYHGIITVYPLLLLASGELRPNWRQLWKVAIFLALIIPFVYSFNAYSGTNYMFLNAPIANSPLMLIYETFGANGYIAGLVMVAVVVWLLQYSLYGLLAKARAGQGQTAV
ncbi:hypothetical protein J40TS1_21700 [Paenibacillus montaniterrae]|uniref:TIGR02206 family membrane protein n=2 Tax=Paenibacillus montaniterrae TaxID=429341 RepID=A0A919YMD9_9BACL|nr:hypothetical protein J40TS1_21700 [Paenibacillus montaniterrae]